MNDEQNNGPEYIIGVVFTDGSKLYGDRLTENDVKEFKESLEHKKWFELSKTYGPPDGFTQDERCKTGFPTSNVEMYKITFDYPLEREQFREKGFKEVL